MWSVEEYANQCSREGAAVSKACEVGIAISGTPLAEVIGTLCREIVSLVERVQQAEVKQAAHEEAAREADLKLEQSIAALGATVEELRPSLARSLTSLQDKFQVAVTSCEERFTSSISSTRQAMEAVLTEGLTTQRSALEDHQLLMEERLRREEEERRRLEELEQERAAKLKERLNALGTKHKHVVSNILREAFTRRVLQTAFFRLRDYQRTRAARRRQTVLCQRLGARTAHYTMRQCFYFLMNSARMKRKRQSRIRHLRAMIGITNRGTLQMRFRTWRAWHAERVQERREKKALQQQMVKTCMQMTAQGTYRYWFSLLLRNRAYQKQRKARHNLVHTIAFQTQQGYKQLVWDKWTRYLQRHKLRCRQRHSAEILMTGSARAVQQRYWDRLALHCRRKKKKKAAFLMASTIGKESKKSSMTRYYTKWRMYTTMQKRKKEKLKLAGMMGLNAPRTLKQIYYHRWMDFAKAYKKRQERLKNRKTAVHECQRYVTRMEKTCMHRFYLMWLNWTARRVKEKQQRQMVLQVDDLRVKLDTVSCQMELAQKTVGNTNSCVQRLVDRLIAVDEALDRLDKDKANRVELRAFAEAGLDLGSSGSSSGDDQKKRDSFDYFQSPVERHVYDGTRAPTRSDSRPGTPDIPPPPPQPNLTHADVALASVLSARSLKSAVSKAQGRRSLGLSSKVSHVASSQKLFGKLT